MKKQPLNLMQKALQHQTLENFVDVLKLTKLEDVVKMKGPFTVFAPINRAFLNLPSELVKRVGNHPEYLEEIMKYHIVPGIHKSDEFGCEWTRSSLLGEYVYSTPQERVAGVNQVKILKADCGASNGILHIIEELLIPRNFILRESIVSAVKRVSA